MKKIVALGASNSQKSINKQFAYYAAGRVQDVELNLLDLNNFVLPLYGPDLENEIGIPENVQLLDAELSAMDGIVLSLAEYNGSYTAAFKNAFDWLSRLDKKVWKGVPMLLLATSPGGRGGASVLNTALTLMPHYGGNVVGSYSLPFFHKNFVDGKMANDDQQETLDREILVFQNLLHQVEA
jgi:chromate reductase